MKKSETGQFLISVIMPIYNTKELWLREAIESVICQTIGFEKNIQLILVNDGSTTDVESTCLEYVEKFPRNIEYIYKENGGVSSARNKGVEYASGQYVNFFDADDVWDKDAFLVATEFLYAHKQDLDVAVCRLVRTGENTSKHPLDWRFEKEKTIVDVSQEKQQHYVQCMIGNCFFKNEIVRKNTIRFKDKLIFGEDTLFVYEAIAQKNRYGLIPDARYLYRIHEENVSRGISLKRILDMEVFCDELYEFDIQKRGALTGYAKHVLAYQIGWMLFYRGPILGLTEKDKEKISQIFLKILKLVDNKILKAEMNYERYIYAIQLKYGDRLFEQYKQDNNKLKIDGAEFFDIEGRKSPFKIYIFEYERAAGSFHIEGTTSIAYLKVPFKLIAKASDGKVYEGEVLEYSHENSRSWDGTVCLEKKRFTFDLPANNNITYTFYATVNGGKETPIWPNYYILAKLNATTRWSYWTAEDKLVIRKEHGFGIKKYSKAVHVFLEKRYLFCIEKTKKNIDIELIKKLRKIAFKQQRKSIDRNKETWLVTDRPFKAGDNAGNFFKYAKTHNENDNIYFSLGKESEDYESMAEYGNLIEPCSIELFSTYFKADKIISSHFDPAVLNPLRETGYYLMDYYNYDFIYLNHGVMPGDLSGMLNKLKKNIKYFSTCGEREYEAIAKGNYYYDESRVFLTGMCRYDALGNTETQKTIVFLPTWRKALAGNVTKDGRDREYIEGFKDTEYYHFYSELISNTRLTDAMKKYGYKGDFFVHPTLRHNAEDFTGNEAVCVHSNLANYEKILNEDQLMITDYSSVAFDFAVQRKPIVYCQFDRAIENELHFYDAQGYFEYERDGFGPVTYSIEDTVNAIIHYIEQDCRNDSKYTERADSFFKFNDHDNCKRTYEAIMSMHK